MYMVALFNTIIIIFHFTFQCFRRTLKHQKYYNIVMLIYLKAEFCFIKDVGIDSFYENVLPVDKYLF